MDEIQQLLDAGLRHIKSLCLRNGKFDNQLFDAQQQVCYDLALSAAELQAARAMTDYAARMQAQSQEQGPVSELAECVAATFAATTSHSILARLQLRAADLGLTRRALQSAVDAAMQAAGSSAKVAALGAHILEQNVTEMPSLLGSEIDMMRQSFARFAEQVVMPLAEHIHRQDTDIPEAIIQQAADLGCFGSCIPQRFGGLQPDDAADSLGMIVVTEALSRGSLGAAGSLITRPEIAARALLSGGTPAQQDKWLPALATGKQLCAISITEPDTGSDVAAVSLRATATKGGWLFNGSKTWCTFAGRSEILVVLARTNPDKSLGHRGLSLFVIEKPAYAGHRFEHVQSGGGKLAGRTIATLGYRGMHSFELFFSDYFVPAENLVGEKQGEGQGFYFTMAGFAGGRIQTAARAIGVMQAAFERAVLYAQQRKTFGKALAAYPLIQEKLARMLATITACRQFSYAVAKLLDNGSGQMEASLVKLFACRAAEWITRDAMQIHGGMGYAEESAVSRYFVDARVLSIFEGSEEVLALKVIARNLVENAA